MKKYITLCLALVCMGIATHAQNLPILLKDIGAGSSFAPIGTNTLFQASDAANGAELWITDGTTAGTQLLKDINPGAAGSNAYYMYTANGKVYFTATDGTNGFELWASDGTAAGTQMVKDINPAGDANPSGFAAYNGKVYFQATDGTNGFELWVTDGTAAGTQMVKDINAGAANGIPAQLTVCNNLLFFQATDATNGSELWVSDGTAAGTHLVQDINPGTANATPDQLIAVNNKLFFTATTAAAGGELWVSDGTAAGTQMAKDINAGASSSYIAYITPFNNKAYFSANDQLWVSDGTTAGTVLVMDIFPSGAYMCDICTFNNKLYIGANHSNANNGNTVDTTVLFASDGTAAGTVPVHTILSNYNYTWTLINFCVYHNKLYFGGQDNVNGWELWQSDGTDAGTAIIRPAVAPNNDPLSNYPVFTVSSGRLYYNATYDASLGLEPYVLQTPDPTAAVPTVTKNINASLYPNPATNTVQLQINLQQALATTISLTDITGRTLQQQTYELNTGDNKIQLSLKGIAPGNYFVRIQAGDDRQVMKLDVQ